MSGGKRSHLRKLEHARGQQARVDIARGVAALMHAPFRSRMTFAFNLATKNRKTAKVALVAGFALGCAGFAYAAMDLLLGVGL